MIKNKNSVLIFNCQETIEKDLHMEITFSELNRGALHYIYMNKKFNGSISKFYQEWDNLADQFGTREMSRLMNTIIDEIRLKKQSNDFKKSLQSAGVFAC